MTRTRNLEADNFDLLGNSELIDSMPNRYMVNNPEKLNEIRDFFAKIPPNKAMRVKLPDESVWKLYSGRLRFYAAALDEKTVSISSRKESTGYFIYVKRKAEEQNG